MKIFLYVMGIILSGSLLTLQSMDIGKNIVSLVNTLESLNDQFFKEAEPVLLVPESLAPLIKSFTEQFNKNYQENKATLDKAIDELNETINNLNTLQGKLFPQYYANLINQNLKNINTLIATIAPKEITPLFFFFILYSDPKKPTAFQKERDTLLRTIDPVGQQLNALLSKLDSVAEQLSYLSEKNIHSLAFLSFFKQLITDPTDTIKESIINAQPLIIAFPTLITMNQEKIENFTRSFINIKSPQKMHEALIPIFTIVNPSIALFNQILRNLTSFLLNEDSINTYKDPLIQLLNQLKEFSNFINQPKVWNIIQANKQELKKIAMGEGSNTYEIFSELKNLPISPQDFTDIATIFDFYTKLFKNKKFNYKEWTTIENIIEEQTKD